MARFSRWAALRYARLIAEVKRDTEVSTAIEETSNATPTASITQSDIDTAIANLVSSAPETLNTLDELSNALGDDANFATSVTTSLGNKANTTMLSNYLQVANSASLGGSSDSLGTSSRSGSTITLDYSTGNVFDVDVLGGADDNILKVSNPDSFSKLKVKLNGQRSVDGAYEILEPRTLVDTNSIVSGWPANGDTLCHGLEFKPDGTKVYIGYSRYIAQFNLSTPWDLSTATYATVGGYGSSYLPPRGGIAINADGTGGWVNVGRTTSSGYAWGVSMVDWNVGGSNSVPSGTIDSYIRGMGRLGPSNTFIIARYDGKVEVRNTLPTGSLVYGTTTAALGISGASIYDFAVNPEGTYVVVAAGSSVYLFKLSVAYDFSTASLDDTWSGTNVKGCAWNYDGTELFTLDSPPSSGNSRVVRKYSFGSTIVNPAVSLYQGVDGTYSGSVPSIEHQGTAYLELSTVDAGNNYYSVVSGSSGSSGSSPPYTVWKSAPVTNATYGVEVAHGQTGTPDKVWVELICTAPQDGYAIGDVVYKDFHFEADESDYVFSCYGNDTYIGYRQNRADEVYRYAAKQNDGSIETGSAGNWDIKICAMWFNSDYVTQA